MKTDKIYIKRLSTLAFHLDKGEDFYSPWTESLQLINNDHSNSILVYRFVLVELIDLFPKNFKITEGPQRVVPANTWRSDMEDYLKDFFGLTPLELLHLFCPENQRPDVFGGTMLYHDSFPTDIAENMFELIKRHGWKNPYIK